jgi:hypothetical protein
MTNNMPIIYGVLRLPQHSMTDSFLDSFEGICESGLIFLLLFIGTK